MKLEQRSEMTFRCLFMSLVCVGRKKQKKLGVEADHGEKEINI